MGEENRFVPNDSLIEEFMDLPELLARVENDRELLTELLVMFRDELPGLLNTLHQVINLGDLAQAARVAHTLKGMSANLSLRRGTDLIKDIEQAAQIGDISLIKNRLVPLDSEIAAFLTAIDAFTVGT
jgi:HPt (histidine-containing phosphotransfer) domain-containing protein